ncbi:MAG: ATP-dependent Clp protease ATP-binding subunit [Butyricicoccus pullicaecorum]|nr:ATP-dependent Clp protease ATP-binding subunit [Butyricicoccus pullicaecorum]
MQMPMCSRCGKNVAVIFITKMDPNHADNTTQEGLCLKCARTLGIKPLDQMMDQMGLNDEALEMLSSEINSLEDLNDLILAGPDMEDEDVEDMEDEGEEDSGNGESDEAFPFPFFRGEKKNDASARKKEKDKKKRKYLDMYCDDLTAKAHDGRLDRIIGREQETDRVIQILNRRQKNNPCLIGEPGVGKTAVAEGLAIRIAAGNVPYKLRDKEVHLLDLTALVAGTQFRGQFESRVKGLVNEVKKLGNIILVIDEVHTIVGAGDSEGAMNAANILKPALSRGEIQVIGATTFAEYRKYIEKDAALERRFQPVTINEPSIEQTVEMLLGIRSYYENFHGVTIPDETCRMAASLSERYITDRYLPDKAIDLIDEACSRLNLEEPAISEMPALKDELETISKKQDDLLQETQDEKTYEQMAGLRSRELQIQSRLDELQGKPTPQLDLEHLAGVIELWTGIPASRVQAQELSRLKGMEERIKQRVIGQNEAIDAICTAIRRSRAGISPKRKPVSFLFVGPTGVGKTELVKVLAQDLFDAPEALIRLDMSEYMEKHAVSRLIGSPPGYVGYDEAGQLTEKIRRRPYSVILLDEIEKAHPDILNILLQILDDGHITDAHGRQVNFENTVIVMTSNAGSQNKTASVGFGGTVSDLGKERAIKALEEIMRPEFLNRIDEIIAFNQLTEEDFSKICEILLGQLAESVETRGIRLTWDDTLVQYLTKKAFSVKYGARNLRRLLEKEVENGLAAEIIEACDHPLTGAHVTADEHEIRIETI